MKLVPLSVEPGQNINVTLGGQPAQISLVTMGGNLYFTLQNGTTPIVSTRICRNVQRLLIDAKYQPFVGDFFFEDTQGDTDPQYQGLGIRYLLWYLEASDLAT